MLLSLLAACTCPPFSDMDVTGAGTPDLHANVAQAIADFAAWTGRDGVCVPGVDVREEVRARGEEVEGSYGGPHTWIWMAADTDDVERTVLHELCHAIDAEEGHSKAHPDLFPGDSISDTKLYPTKAARQEESFAQACSTGASEMDLSLTLDAVCGGSRWGLDIAYAQTEIYSAFPRTPVTDAGVDLRVTTRTLDVGADLTVVDAVAVESTLLLLVERSTPEGTIWGLVSIDPATGTRLRTLPLGTGTAAEAGVQLVRSDGPARLLVGWTEGDRDLLDVDLATGTTTALVEGLDIPYHSTHAAWSEGALYVTGHRGDGTPLMVEWAGDTLVSLDPAVSGYTIRPMPGGVEVYASGAVLHYVGGVGSIVLARSIGTTDVVPVGDTWRLDVGTAGIGRVWVLTDVESGSQGLLAEPCQTLAHYPTTLVTVGVDIFLFDPVTTDATGRAIVPMLQLGA
ncbi:MAG: hypothetical protein V4850_37055 [Myxococcota bacterium]